MKERGGGKGTSVCATKTISTYNAQSEVNIQFNSRLENIGMTSIVKIDGQNTFSGKSKIIKSKNFSVDLCLFQTQPTTEPKTIFYSDVRIDVLEYPPPQSAPPPPQNPPPAKPRFPTVLTIGDETNQSFVNGYLKTTNGTPLSQQQITLNINYDDTNKNYKHTTTTDSSGKFSHYFKYHEYVSDVQAIFSGSANYEPSSDNRISEDDLGLDKLKIEMDNLLLAFGSEGFIIVTIVIITIIAAIFKRKIRNWVKVIMKYIPKIYPRKPPLPSPPPPPPNYSSGVPDPDGPTRFGRATCKYCHQRLTPSSYHPDGSQTCPSCNKLQ
jgi:hypothetical protein